MAVYAALISLTHTLHQILHPPPLNKITINTQQIELLRCKVCFMIDFLEAYYTRHSPDIADLSTKIRDAAYEAQDVIESNIINQIQYRRNTKKNSALLHRGIQKVLEKFVSVEKELLKIKSKQGEEARLPQTSRAGSSRTFPGDRDIMVGSEKHLLRIITELATDESNRRVVAVVGMGGIGKTTLATSVYNNSFIVEHFHVRAWITVSHEYTVRELLVHLLSEVNKACPSVKESTEEELGLQIYKELFDRKYLIVMDDMWNVQVWERMRKFIPRNENGSRILVTTRLSHLVLDFESCTPYVMEFLDEGQSWDLLRRKIFAKGNCPDDLEGMGKGIARRCSGLPLALVVIGGLLAKKRRREHWESIAGDVTSALNCETDEQLRKILSLSYIHLPLYLKPCFLYLAMFPEDFEVHVTTLVRLWVAEGIIRRNEGKTMEEIAEEYLEDLISRNLVLVHKRGSGGKVKSCKIHDLIRELCIAEAEKEKFLCAVKLDDSVISSNIETARRLSVSSPGKAEMTAIEALRAAAMNRTWFSHDELFEAGWWTGRGSEEEASEMLMVNQVINEFRLLNVVHMKNCDTTIDISKLRNMRYLAARSVSPVSSMFLCWNLQTLVVDEIDAAALPAEIWKMPQLRHLMMYEIALPDPPDDAIVLENLATLGTIENFKCTEQVWKRIPNFKKLQISYDFRSAPVMGDYCLQNIIRLEKLESLGIQGANKKLWTDIRLPNSLKKLVLENCKIAWDDLSVVGKLPDLEVLKLYFHATEGEEWNPVEGEFCRLKFLLICASDLRIWGAESSHFPCIESLVLSGVILEEIPASFAEIMTLEEVRLGAVHDSVWSSARDVSHQRELLGYGPLQIRQV